MSEFIINEKRDEYGDWQTNLPLAISICEHIKSQGIRPQVIIEPTCGQGNFILAALLTFDTIEDVYGIEIYKPYLNILNDKLQKLEKPLDNVNIHLYHKNIFDFEKVYIVDETGIVTDENITELVNNGIKAERSDKSADD